MNFTLKIFLVSFALLLSAVTVYSCEKFGVECALDTSCNAPTPYCDTEPGKCVTCLENTHCEGHADGPTCREGQCGPECLDSSECTSSALAHCDTTAGACVACTEDADCDSVSGLSICVSGTCEVCTAGKEEACGDYICEPDGVVCSTTVEKASKTNCQSCVADSECIANHKCVPMDYDTSFHGNYCLKINNADCVEPFRSSLNKVSVSSPGDSEPEVFCGIVENLTTCEAVLAWGQPCSVDSKCLFNGEEALGSLCRTVASSANSCTYPCNDYLECNPSRICFDAGGSNPDYCDAAPPN
ncbi:MAG: hypothetical protein IPJ88_11940 [Myxococcales bacterium]|nr:MAG: hypothetical protein IPJ88_11940 [Myxococcales bacterium]